MLQNKKIVFLGGYANVGKTTAMNIIENQFDIKTLSCSGQLHSMLSDFADQIGYSYDTRDRNAKPFSLDITHRTALISYAASITNVDPFFFPRLILEIAKDSKDSLIAIETIGGEEFTYFSRECARANIEVVKVNIRAKSEQPGVDKRCLLPNASTIYNDMVSESEFANQLKPLFI